MYDQIIENKKKINLRQPALRSELNHQETLLVDGGRMEGEKQDRQTMSHREMAFKMYSRCCFVGHYCSKTNDRFVSSIVGKNNSGRRSVTFPVSKKQYL